MTSDERLVDLEALLRECLKPEAIAVGSPARLERIWELLRWFERFSRGMANPKWFRGHAFELAYFIASEARAGRTAPRRRLALDELLRAIDAAYAKGARKLEVRAPRRDVEELFLRETGRATKAGENTYLLGVPIIPDDDVAPGTYRVVATHAWYSLDA